MIRITELTKRFGPLHVLRGLDLEIAAGRVTAILGPNGAGKTTLMKTILGLTRSDGGKILVDGERVSDDPAYRSHIGYMPQIARFPENLTVDELFAMLRDLRDGGDDVDIELFARYELGTMGHKRLGQLSGGTRQKILAAMALLFGPKILILDEPTVGLDPVATTAFKDKLRKERAAGHTILLSSHLVNEVEELADNIIYLQDGRPFFDGTIAEIRQQTSETRLDRALVRVMEGAKEVGHGSRR